MPDAKFCLVFQRETLSVPVMRRVLGFICVRRRAAITIEVDAPGIIYEE